MDDTYLVRNSGELPSPSLLVYPRKIAENTERALEIAGGPERLRPHIKTHKTREILAIQRKAGIEKFKCATIAEAEMLASAGVKDILLAYQMVGPNAQRFSRLCAGYPDVRFETIVDDLEAARGLSSAAAALGVEMEVLLDIDPGMGRTGVRPDRDAAALYLEVCSLKGLKPGGLHCFDGHNNQQDPDTRMAAAEQCHREVAAVRNQVEAFGGVVPRLVMGGTSTFPCYARIGGIELSPGTCFLQDWNYLKRFEDLPFQPAALIFSRVISKPLDDRITLDTGSKAIATDQPVERGVILNLSDTKPLFQSEEHWVFETPNAQSIPIAAEAYLLPAHICPTVARHPLLYVIDEEGKWVDSWRVAARDRVEAP